MLPRYLPITIEQPFIEGSSVGSGGYLMPHLCRLLYQLSQRPIADEENSVPPPNGN